MSLRKKLTRVAIFDVRTMGDVPARVVAAFDQSLAPEIRKLDGVSAISSAEIRDVLAVERQKQLLGCSDDTSCIAEIAGAMDVGEVLSTDIALSGSNYTLTMRRVDVSRSQVLQSVTRRVEKKDGEELLALVGPVIQELFPDRALKAGKTRGVAPEVAKRLNPPPLPRWVFFTTAGAGVVALGAGGAFGWLANDAASQHRQRTRSGEEVSGSELKLLEKDALDNARNANILFGVGGALVLAAGIEALFTDWSGHRAAVNLAAGATADGLTVGLAGDF